MSDIDPEEEDGMGLRERIKKMSSETQHSKLLWLVSVVVYSVAIALLWRDHLGPKHSQQPSQPEGRWFRSWAEAQKFLPFFATPSFWEVDPVESWDPESIHDWMGTRRLGFWRPKNVIFGIKPPNLEDHGVYGNGTNETMVWPAPRDHAIYSGGTNFLVRSNRWAAHPQQGWGIQIYNQPTGEVRFINNVIFIE